MPRPSSGSAGRRIVGHDELPEWARDNEFIISGYRTPGGTRDHWRGSTREPSDHSGRASHVSTRDDILLNGQARKRKSTVPASDSRHDGDELDFFEHSSFHRCWKSIWAYVHNETVNIHSHLWGAVIAVLVLGLHLLGTTGQVPQQLHFLTHHSVFYPRGIEPIAEGLLSSSLDAQGNLSTAARQASAGAHQDLQLTRAKHLGALFSSPVHASIAPWGAAEHRPNDWKDIGGFATFLFGAITVLTCSATFHTMVCHSKAIAHSFNKLDYIGIVAMIVGSFLPMLHYGFYCHPRLQLLYSVAIISLGSFASYTVLSHKYATPAYRPIRTSVFLALGLSAIFPVAHILAMYGYEAVSRTMGLDFLVAGGALYVVGAGLYVARIPERLSPGTFDYIGASHQIFHILILAAAFCHYVCIRRAYTFWHTVESLGARSTSSGSNDSAALAVMAVCRAFDELRAANT